MIRTRVEDLANDYEKVDDVVEIDEIPAEAEKSKGVDGRKIGAEKSVNLKNDDTATRPPIQMPRPPPPYQTK